jgi:hypothetical protein
MNRRAWFAVAMLITLIGCAPLAVNYDYDTAADFTAMKTFSWMPPTGNAVADDLLVKKIRNAVNVQLKAKGRTEVPENQDFLIAMQLSGKTTYGGSTAVGASVGIPVGRAGTISVGGGKSKPKEKTEGTLVLDFLDAKTQSLVWRATATAAVEPKVSPEEQQARINEVIAAMLVHFPPKK